MSNGPRRKKHEDHEEHENHERWLVSYADMITVLMALFLVLFAISIVDQTKFESLKRSLASSLGQKVTVLEGGKKPAAGKSAGDGALDFGEALLPPTSPQMAAQVDRAVKRAKAQEALKEAERTRASVEQEVRSLEGTRKKIVSALDKKKMAGSVRFRYDARGLVVSVVTDKVLFAPNRASLSPTGRRVLSTVGPVLRTIPNELLVEGHTDTTAAGPKYYPTEWELSSARATTVVRHLIDSSAIPAKRLSATGHADQRPLVAGTSTRANRINRRVEIVIVSTLPPEERALLPVVAPSVINKGGAGHGDAAAGHAEKSTPAEKESSGHGGTAPPHGEAVGGHSEATPSHTKKPSATEKSSGDGHGNGHSAPAH